MHFIETDSGWINLDHCRSVKTNNDQSRVLFYDADGGFIAGKRYRGDVTELLSQVIPAAAGATAVVVSICSEDNARPVDVDVFVSERAIIGWRLAYEDSPTPILTEATCGGEIVLIREPDGTLLEPLDTTYPDLTDAKRSLLLRAQGEWDRKHAADTQAERVS